MAWRTDFAAWTDKAWLRLLLSGSSPRRYLRARRKEKVVSVVTVISVVGVAAGVMALVISLAVNNGFRDTLQRSLLSATAHVNILKKQNGEGIPDWRELSEKVRRVPHVVAVAPVLYDKVFIAVGSKGKEVVLKGIDIKSELATSEVLHHLKSGSLDGLRSNNGLPGIIIGSKAAADTGLDLRSVVTVISPQGTLTPFGPPTRSQRFRVIGIFESGFYDFDDHWTYSSLTTVQKLLSVGDVVNDIEIRADDPASLRRWQRRPNLWLATPIRRTTGRIKTASSSTRSRWSAQ